MIDELIQNNELLISKDYTCESDIMGINENVLNNMIVASKINIIDSKHFGCKDKMKNQLLWKIYFREII